MNNQDVPRRPPPSRDTRILAESIFPTFAVNVPMPKDTAVPGSYNKPVQGSRPDRAKTAN